MKRKKNKEYKESQIATINIFCFTYFIKKIYFVRKNSLKKSSLYHHILFTVSIALQDIWNAVKDDTHMTSMKIV